jgi:hypothetical protein
LEVAVWEVGRFRAELDALATLLLKHQALDARTIGPVLRSMGLH